MGDEKLKDKISDDDRKTINDKCDETIKWLDANQTAEQDEYADKQKEIEGVCNPIITRLQEELPVVCQAACPVVCPEACLEHQEPAVPLPEADPDPDPPSRRSTKHFRSQPSTLVHIFSMMKTEYPYL